MKHMDGVASGQAHRRPTWLRKPSGYDSRALETRRTLADLRLHTVCESAQCPNRGECYAAGAATFIILGDRCTRACRFCAVDHGGELNGVDEGEGIRIGQYVKDAGIVYAVITSVTRDDLDDGGASHFARVLRDLRRADTGCRVELLVPDFRGSPEAVDLVCAQKPEVIGHNLETVAGLYPRVRPGADYLQSLDVIGRIAQHSDVVAKTGIMVGLGEERAELRALFRDVAARGARILTIGQYLRPRRENLPVSRYYEPEEFEELQREAEQAGVPTVVSGAYVRSSYLAEAGYLACLDGAERLVQKSV